MEPIAWLILFCLFVLIEIATLGLTTIWFAGGSMVAFVLAMFEVNMTIQIIVFFAVSLILLIFTRPLAVSFFNKSRVATNVDSLIGKKAKVTETIDNFNNEGTIVVDGQTWTARSVDGTRIETYEEVVIVRINGVKAIVEKSNILN